MDAAKVLTQAERIVVRRERVLAKLQQDNEEITQQRTQQQEAQQSISKQQITKSRQTVDNSTETAEETLSDIRVERLQDEANRRSEDTKNRALRIERVEREIEYGTQVNREIESSWSSVAEKTVPQELYQAIGEQYQKSSGLLQNKDALIKHLQKELKSQDEAYVNMLALHQDDIVNLMNRMREQFHRHVSVCEEQLHNIEKEFVGERKGLLESNMAQIKSLFEKRTEMEQKILTDIHERENRFQDELSRIRNLDADDYTSLKVTLENNVQLLEQQLEQMRATYQLNSEKLDYNYSVLEERDAENKVKMEVLRQKTLKLRTQLAAAIAKFNRERANYDQINRDLTKEYNKVTAHYQDLQRKFRHFENADQTKFQEIWCMKEEEALRAAKRVLYADKLIHEQILNVKWSCPIHKLNLATATVAPVQSGIGSDPEIESLTTSDVFYNSYEHNNNSIARHFMSEENDEDNEEGNDHSNNNTLAGEFSSPNSQIKQVLQLISKEAGFLLDNRSRELIKSVSEDDRELYTIDHVLRVLDVHDQEDLDELVQLFYDSSNNKLKHPNDVVRLLREFMNVRQRIGGLDNDDNNDNANNDGDNNVGNGGQSSQSKSKEKAAEISEVKKARRREKERRFWTKLSNVLGEGRLRLWQSLSTHLRKYNGILEERTRLVDDTTQLAKQNQELKVLLQEYLGSKINYELQVPPTRMIKVDPKP